MSYGNERLERLDRLDHFHGVAGPIAVQLGYFDDCVAGPRSYTRLS